MYTPFRNTKLDRSWHAHAISSPQAFPQATIGCQLVMFRLIPPEWRHIKLNHVADTIDENYRVITLILKKYGNLPLYLENYALFSLPPIFTTILYTYPLRYIIYLGEPSGNIISNCHGTFIHICIDMILYLKYINETVVFPRLIWPFFFGSLFFLANNKSRIISLFTSWVFSFSCYQ